MTTTKEKQRYFTTYFYENLYQEKGYRLRNSQNCMYDEYTEVHFGSNDNRGGEIRIDPYFRFINKELIKIAIEAGVDHFAFDKIGGAEKFNLLLSLGEHSTPEIINALVDAKREGLFDAIPQNYFVVMIATLGRTSTAEKIKALAYVNAKGLFKHNSLEGKALVDTIVKMGMQKSPQEIYAYVKE